MKRTTFEVAEKIVDKIIKLEKTIFGLQDIANMKSYKILSSDSKVVELNEGDIATEVFIQDILDYYINTLNLELSELQKELENL